MPAYTDPNPNPASPEPEEQPGNKSNAPTPSSGDTNPVQQNTSSSDANEQDIEQKPSAPTSPNIKDDSPKPTPESTTNMDVATQPQPPTTDQVNQKSLNDPSIIVNPSSGGSDSSSNIKKFALPVLGVLLLLVAVGAGVTLVRQNQNIEEEASENCVPPTAGEREWWSVEILGNRNNRPSTDTGQITGLEPGTTEVVVEAWSDSAFGCGTNQQDETAQVTVNGQTVTVTDTDVPGSTTVQVDIPLDGILNISATALGDPGSMFVFVRVPEPPPVACEIPPAEGRIILNFTDQGSLLESLQQAQSFSFNTGGDSYRVLIQMINAEGNKEFFVVLIDNQNDQIFITRVDSINSLPNTLEEYEELSDDDLTIGPDESALETLISSHTGQDPESISIICASFEEYDLQQVTPTPTETQTQYGASCEPVTALDLAGNTLSGEELSQLTPGDNIRFLITFEANEQSTVDMARVRVNQTDWIQTSESEGPGTFYLDYTIPDDINRFNIDAQVHVQENDTWY